MSMRKVEVDCSGESRVYPTNAPGSFRIRPTPCVAGPAPAGGFCAQTMPITMARDSSAKGNFHRIARNFKSLQEVLLLVSEEASVGGVYDCASFLESTKDARS